MKTILTILAAVLLTIVAVVMLAALLKAIWVAGKTWRNDRLENERKDIIRRANYLVAEIENGPEQLIQRMPDIIDEQFKEEWAIYSLSMTTKALANMASLFPEKRNFAIEHIEKIIGITLTPAIRHYDKMRWGEDPLDGIQGEKSHISYHSILAWMIGCYKQIGGGNKYDRLYHSLCEAMNRKISRSPILNLPTYPGEPVYVPDMLVAIVALSDYSRLYNGMYKPTVDKWILRAKQEWLDSETGLLASTLSSHSGEILSSPRGSFSALNCYYLSLIDPKFAEMQYKCLKKHFAQKGLLAGIKEFHDRTCLFGVDVDAGPVVFNLSPSGTAFSIGCATCFNDKKFRKKLLRTAEIAGFSITWRDKTHYLLANFAFVGEAVALAMRTSSINE
jgi:hypothetical protein